MKDVKNQNPWNFELGSQESINVPMWIILGFQQRDRQDSQNLNNDFLCRLPVVSAQSIICIEKIPEAGISFTYYDNDYSQGYHQIKETFRALTKDNILQPKYQLMISDLQTLGLMILDIVYMFWI